ncbi:MAG: hypothetical protein ACI4IQ_03720 [Eubacterium sp.]
MKKNIKSSRMSYKNFTFDDSFTPTQYSIELANPVKNDTLLILSKSRKASLERVKKIVSALKGKGITIYVREYFEKDFEKISYVTAVTKDSDEYYNALATSQYIYIDTFLYADFIKKPGQILINHITAKPSNVKNRINICSAKSKSDYFIDKKTQDQSITFEDFLGRLCEKNLPSKQAKSDKKKLLFILNLEYFNSLYCTFENITQWLDYEKYDVTMLFDWKYVEQYGERIGRLDDRITILAKKRRILCDEETSKRLAFLKNEYNFIRKPKKINAFLPEDLFLNEQKRLFGDVKYDFIINMKYDVFYWRWLMESMNGRLISVDMNDYTGVKTPYKKGKAFYMGRNDAILFMSKDAIDSAVDFKKRIFAKKSSLLPYIPIKSRESLPIEKSTNINGRDLLIINCNHPVGLDSLSVILIDRFESNSIPYTVIDNRMTDEQAVSFINSVVEKENELFVFDFYNVLSKNSVQSIRSNESIHYYTIRQPYYYLLNRLGACYLYGSGDPGVYYEARLCKKNTVFCDENANELSQIKTPVYKFKTLENLN